MATQFYKTEKTSETGKKVQNLIDKGRDIEKGIEKFLEDIGAGKKYIQQHSSVFGTGICGVAFEEEPDKKVWKKFPKFEGYYKPRLSCEEGKKIQDTLNSFAKVTREDLNLSIGYKSFLSNCGIDLKSKTHFGFQTDSDWKHKMPKDCVEITFSEYNKLFNTK